MLKPKANEAYLTRKANIWDIFNPFAWLKPVAIKYVDCCKRCCGYRAGEQCDCPCKRCFL